MSQVNNKNDFWIFAKSYLFSIMIIVPTFYLSAYTFSKILKNDEVVEVAEQNDEDMFSQFLEKEKMSADISNDSSYVIYANTDPVIQKIELFLSKNRHNLSEEELEKVEKFRSERITFLMAKKFKDISKTKQY